MSKKNILVQYSTAVCRNYIKQLSAIGYLVMLVIFVSGCSKETSDAGAANLAQSSGGTNSGTNNVALAAINLQTANDFTILSETGITTTGVTAITGDIGSSPIASIAITGFGLIMDTNNQSSHTPTVTGKVYGPDYAVPTPSKMTPAVSDMETAFTTANGITNPSPMKEMYAGDISGRTLAAGLYKWTTGVLVTNAGVTLTGGPNDVWIFQIAQNLVINNSAIITLSGGAQAKNIFWVVSGQVTLGTSADFSGIILSKTLISLNTGAKVTGKLFAQTAVTMIANTVKP